MQDRHGLRFQTDRLASIGDVAPREASVLSNKIDEEYPALYRQHAFCDPKQLGQRLSDILQDTALEDLLASSDDILVSR